MNKIDSLPFIQPIATRHTDEDISAADWLSQITLCLAPLIIHIFIGVPTAVYLYRKEPKWHDQLGFYNPTTIIWRYMAILDRRVRAKKWKSIDMAATNERFWTEKGWDGSEKMMEMSREFCTRIPHRSHVRFVSKTMLESVIILGQGVQAGIEMLNGGQGGWTTSIGTVFYPLTLFGLLRIPAAGWLSEEGNYTSVHSEETMPFSGPGGENDEEYLSPERVESRDDKIGLEMLSARTTGLTLHPYHTQRFQSYPRNNWRGRVVRGFYLCWLLALAALCLKFLIPHQNRHGTVTYSITTIVEIIVYAFLALSSVAIFSYYSFKHNTSTTIIPCIQSLWYKVYTVVLFAMMLVLLILAAIETHKEPCGSYSTTRRGFAQCKGGVYLFPYGQVGVRENGDQAIWVEGGPGRIVNQSTVKSRIYGGVYRGFSDENGTNVRLEPFVGWCKGNSFASVEMKTGEVDMKNATDWVQPFLGTGNASVNISMPSNGLRDFGVPISSGLEVYGE